tara:strand:+ start:48 stop:233 length:186 start_codon:yes stop_codon:yes gene_type:complete
VAKSKEQRSEEAKERAKIYRMLTPTGKLELIRSRRGKSNKEKAKILSIIKEKNSEKSNKEN